MEEIMGAVDNLNLAAAPPPPSAAEGGDALKKSRIQVSNTKKPLFFYVNLAKRYMQQHIEVELSALGMAIAPIVLAALMGLSNSLPEVTRSGNKTVAAENVFLPVVL